jgi:hypothetical protein
MYSSPQAFSATLASMSWWILLPAYPKSTHIPRYTLCCCKVALSYLIVSLTIEVALNSINSHKSACTSSTEAVSLCVTLAIVLVPDTTDVSKTNGVRAKVQVRPIGSGEVGAEAWAVAFKLAGSNDGTTVSIDNINSRTANSTSGNAKC